MLQLERQKLILEYLKQNRKATTNELSEMLGVSTTTIRTDFMSVHWKIKKKKRQLLQMPSTW